MGRCYEFGVSLHDDCEQAMVVPADGGHCICASCGADCPGQFNACGVVTSQPGYVPITAPAWAKPGHSRTTPPAVPSALAALAGPDDLQTPTRHILDVEGSVSEPAALELRKVGSVLASVRSMLEAALERPDRLNEALAILNKELQVRDGELAAAFARMTAAYEHLTQEVIADREARQAIGESVEKLSDRLDGVERAAESAPVTGFGVVQ